MERGSSRHAKRAASIASAVAVIVLGVLAARESILVQGRKAPGFAPLSFLAIPLSEIAGFTGPVLSGFALRRKSSSRSRRSELAQASFSDNQTRMIRLLLDDKSVPVFTAIAPSRRLRSGACGFQSRTPV